jgi:hypothetical protein
MEVKHMIKMYKVTGLGNHRQRESFFPSYKFEDFEKIKTTVFNSDITETNDYSIVMFEADTKEKIEEALDGQLYEGIFENSNFGEVIEITDKEEINKYVNEYVPNMNLIMSATYYKKWKDSTIQRGKVEEITREEALEIIRKDLTLAETFTDEDIEIEIRLFDKYHVIDLGDYMITIERIDE